MKNRKKKTTLKLKESSEGYMTEDKLIKIIEKELPSLLAKKPKLKAKLKEMLEDVFVTKEEIKAVLQEIKYLRIDMNQRFEEINKRFEEINKRFEEIDRRFEEINRRFERIDKRFEKVDKRFEDMQKQMDKRFEQTIKTLSSKIDTLGSRWGIMAEDTIRQTFEELLSDMGFTVIKWKKKDEKREVFLHPRDAEIDILIKDGKTYAVEVKSSLTAGEVDTFLRSVMLYEKTEGKKVDKKIIITVYPYPGVKEYAKRAGVKILSHIEDIKKIQRK